MIEEKLLIKYNELIARLGKADAFLQSSSYKNKVGEMVEYKDIEQEFKIKSKFFDEYNNIIKQLSNLQTLYFRITGQEMNLEEKLNGFTLTI